MHDNKKHDSDIANPQIKAHSIFKVSLHNMYYQSFINT